MKNQNIVTVEITDSHIKILQALISQNGPAVTGCYTHAIKPQSDTDISKIIASIFHTEKIKTENIIVAVPRRFAIMRHLSLPSHTDEEIEKMVRLQVIKQVPYPKEDIVLDYNILKKEHSGYAKVLVVVVHKEVVGRYLGILKSAGLTATKLALSSEGLLNWLSFQDKKTRRKKNGPALLVNVDTTNSEICFCHNENLLFSRNINFGAHDLSPEHVSVFVEQIALTISTYTRENIGEDISRIVLVSSSGEIVTLKEKLDAEYSAVITSTTEAKDVKSVSPARIGIEVHNPMDNAQQKRTKSIGAVLDKEGVSFAVNLGLVLSTDKKIINLLPHEVRDTRKVKQQRKEWTRFLILCACAFIFGVAIFAAKIYKNTTYLQELTETIRKIDPQVQEIQKKKERLSFMFERLNPSVSINDVIDELYKVTPNGISFKMIHLAEGGTMDLHGVSKEESSVNVFQKNLVNSTLFNNVTLQYATKRKIFRGELTDFKIKCQVSRRAR